MAAIETMEKSIATGVPPAQHGIRTPEVRRWRGQSSWIQETPLELAVHSIMVHAGFGQRQPVSGYLRKMKTFWEILSDNGLRVGVMNWWGSWPAKTIRGWNISERYYYKLAANGLPQDETYPPALFQQYKGLYQGSKQGISGPELDRFYMRIFQEQLKKDSVRVAALYLPGFDILNYEHFDGRKMDPFSYAEIYTKQIRWLDEQIQQLRDTHPDYRLLILFYQGRSLPGHQSAVLLPEPSSNTVQALSEYDIAPYLLYSCGLPLADGMRVQMIQASVTPERLAKMPVRFVGPFEAPKDRVDSSHVDQFNDLLVEQMKSLGYLQ